MSMNIKSIGVQHNEVVGRNERAATQRSVFGRTFEGLKGAVRSFFDVQKGDVWAFSPMRETKANKLKALHAA